MIFMRILTLVFGILRLASLLMDCLCIAPLTPVVMVMRGLVFHPWFRMFSISGSYLTCLCVRACSRESIMAWQNVSIDHVKPPTTQSLRSRSKLASWVSQGKRIDPLHVPKV